MYAQFRKLAFAATALALVVAASPSYATSATLIDTQEFDVDGIAGADGSVSLFLGTPLTDKDPLTLLPDPDSEVKVYLDGQDGLKSFYGSLDKNTAAQDVLFKTDTNADTGNGFANIKPSDNKDAIGQLIVSVPGKLFGDLLFDIQLNTFDTPDTNPEGGNKNDNSTTNNVYPLIVEAFDALSNSLAKFIFPVNSPDLKGNADLSFLLISTLSNIDRVVLTSMLDPNPFPNDINTKGFKELKHFKLSEITTPCVGDDCGGGGPGVVPVPGALPLLLSGLAGFGFLATRRKKTIAA
jgi:hypothetical protein